MLIKIFLFIKIGSQVGALNTILLVFITAFFGIIYARYEGFNTLRSGMSQIVRNELPVYEIISGAALAFAALLLIIPGFLTDLFGFLLIIPITRKFFVKLISSNLQRKKDDTNIKEGGDIIEGSFEEKKQENDKKDN